MRLGGADKIIKSKGERVEKRTRKRTKKRQKRRVKKEKKGIWLKYSRFE
jgi:hypothetical protein